MAPNSEKKLRLRQSIFEYFRCQINHYQNSISKWSSHRFPFSVENSHIFAEIPIFSKTGKIKNLLVFSFSIFFLQKLAFFENFGTYFESNDSHFQKFFAKIPIFENFGIYFENNNSHFQIFFGKISIFENFENFWNLFWK